MILRVLLSSGFCARFGFGFGFWFFGSESVFLLRGYVIDTLPLVKEHQFRLIDDF